MTKKPFFERLKEYFDQVNAVLRGEASSASIFPNTSDIGLAREAIYAKFLKSHLPTNCNVLFGGFLFAFDGTESKQVDLIITNDICPQYNFHNQDGTGKSFACIDGTLAVASIKSTLNSSELIDSIDNIASLPSKLPLQGRVPPGFDIFGYDDWPYKIIFASTSISTEALLETLNNHIKEKNIPTNKRPNIIHVSGKCCIIRSGPNGGYWGGKPIKPNNYHAIDISDSYGLLHAITNIQQISDSSRSVMFDYYDLLKCIPWR